ncbi:MAG: SDR family oxidoreductase [Proteobacteria bacterium]|nr:SDR family oxidoreductase [Pseudomonadota bacterium]
MRIAVMGATGQLGRATVDHLIGQVGAENVVAVARTPSKASDLAARGVVVRAGDYADVGSLRSAFDGVDTVHLIPTKAMPRERVQQVQNAIDSAKAAGVRRLVHVGIVGTDVTNKFVIMPYLLYAESAIVTSGLAWTLLRNAYYAEPIADWLPEIVRMGTIPYPFGEGSHAWATREDMARAAAAVLASGEVDGEILNLTGPAAHTVEELCAIVSRVTGQTVTHRDASVQDYIDASIADGEPEPFARLLATLYDPVRDGLTSFATTDIERITGKPPESMESFLGRVWRA